MDEYFAAGESGSHHDRVPDEIDGIKREKEREKDMGWILGLAATAAVFVAGTAGLACVAVCKISQCRLD